MLTNLPSIPGRQLKKSDTKTGCSFPGPGTESLCVAGAGLWVLRRPAPQSLGAARQEQLQQGQLERMTWPSLESKDVPKDVVTQLWKLLQFRLWYMLFAKQRVSRRWEMGQCTLPCHGWLHSGFGLALWISPFAFIRLSHQSLQNLSWLKKKKKGVRENMFWDGPF